MNIIHAILGAAGMAALILDGQTALAGASAGMELCLRTVIPSLFPFLFFCGVLTSSLWGSRFSFLRPLTARLGIPRGAESLLIAALLGGYPAGAQQIGVACQEGRLKKQDAHHLLTFCSNAGPAFLFGITALQFSSLSQVWALWAIQILSCLITGRLHAGPGESEASLSPREADLSRLLVRTVKTTGILCGWILLFQIMLAFLERWFFWALPETAQVVLTGLLELSSGCCVLSRIPDEQLRFLACSGILSFGGLCVTMQTSSVIRGLSLAPYLWGKGMQMVLSLGISMLYLRFGWPAFLLFLVLFPTGRKKAVDLSKQPVYNEAITTGRKNPCCFAKK